MFFRRGVEQERKSEETQGLTPKHVMIIPESADVWHEPSSEFATLRVLEKARETGTSYVTFQLPTADAIASFSYLPELVDNLVTQLKKTDVRLCHYGQLGETPQEFQEAIRAAEEQTRGNNRQTVFLAFGSGQQELVYAAKRIAGPEEQITPETIQDHFYHPYIPDVDMILFMGISGERPFIQLHSSLIFQSAYAEIVTLPDPFDELREDGVYEHAVNTFIRRERKYGRLPNQ